MSHVTPIPLSSCPRVLLRGNGLGSRVRYRYSRSGKAETAVAAAAAETVQTLAYFFGDADGLSDASTRSSLTTSRTPLVRRAIRSAWNLSSAVGTLP